MGKARGCACWALLLALASCAPEAPGPGVHAMPAHDGDATSAAGMVVTGSPYATEAGILMLEQGGNAVDAAVAAAFALAVAEPTQSGLGGRTQILIRMADQSVLGIDGTTQVPMGYDSSVASGGEHGHGAVGIPGTVAALAAAAERAGTLGLAALVSPAERWAREGLSLPPGEASRLAGVAGDIDPSSEVAHILFSADGSPLAAGDALVQPDLGRVLADIGQNGADAFYRGDIARRIAEDMAAHGGYVTEADLSGYQAAESEVGRGRFGDYEVVGSYLPASGVTVIEILQILDGAELHRAEGPWTIALVESLLAGFEDREIARALPARQAVAWLTSDSLARRRSDEVVAKIRTPSRAAAVPSDWTSALALDNGAEPAFTTHVSVADTFGNVVALTQSLGPMLGARVMTPGLGFLYASTMGGYLEGESPGYRPWSSQAPLILVREGRPALVLGGAGSRRILSAMVSTLDRTVRGGQNLTEALKASRLHPSGTEVWVEEGWNVASFLEAAGYRAPFREPSYFARLNAVQILLDGRFRGVGEPRWVQSSAGGPRR